MRVLLALVLVVAASGCGQWRGHGHDELVPSPLGQSWEERGGLTEKRDVGMPPAINIEQADENIVNNRVAAPPAAVAATPSDHH